MTENTHRGLVAVGALLAFALGWRLLVSPSTRAEESIRLEIARLGEPPAIAPATARLESLGRELLAVRSLALDEPALPREPRLEALIDLSQRADPVGAAGRTVRTGQTRAPAFGGPASAVALPIAVHLEATLDPTLSLVEAVAEQGTALRIESIEIVAARTSGRGAHEPLLVSTIEVEALYEPARDTGDGEP